MFLWMSVDACHIEELSKEDLAKYVSKSLCKFGFPERGYTRYVFLRRGHMFQTDDLDASARIDIYDGELAFGIVSWEEFIEQYQIKVSENISDDEKINIYITKTIYEK